MKINLLFLFLNIATITAVYADLNIIDYTVKGIVKNEQGALITNDTLLVIDGSNKKKVVIHGDGTFEVNLKCTIPCLTGHGGFDDPWVQQQTHLWNGEELFFWMPNSKVGQIVEGKWQRYYAELLKEVKDRQILEPDSIELRLTEKFWLRPMQNKKNWQCKIKKKDKQQEFSYLSDPLIVELLRLIKVGGAPIDTALKWWNLCGNSLNIINEQKVNIRVRKHRPNFYEKNYFFVLDDERRIAKRWSKIRRKRYD